MRRSYYFIIVTSVLCLSNCCRKGKIPCPEFTAEESAWMPNRPEEMLNFKSNIGNEVRFKAGPLTNVKEYSKYTPKNTCPDYCEKSVEQKLIFVKNPDNQVDLSQFVLKSFKSRGVYSFKIENSYMGGQVFDFVDNDNIDLLTVNGVPLKNVLEYKRDTVSNFTHWYRFFYTKSHGMVRFDNKNGETYERVF